MRALETQKEAPERPAQRRADPDSPAAVKPVDTTPQASRFSPDLNDCTDRYRLVTPYTDK